MPKHTFSRLLSSQRKMTEDPGPASNPSDMTNIVLVDGEKIKGTGPTSNRRNLWDLGSLLSARTGPGFDEALAT